LQEELLNEELTGTPLQEEITKDEMMIIENIKQHLGNLEVQKPDDNPEEKNRTRQIGGTRCIDRRY